jgi:hypothetical protein
VTVPVWLAPTARKRRQNRLSGQQERVHARRVGGRTQPGSGSSWRAKGDVISPEHLDELKFTDGKQYSLTVTSIRKITRAAVQLGRTPRVIIDFKQHGVRAIVIFEDLP